MILKIEHIAKKLRKARKAKQLSQRALSQKISLPQSHISNIEQGKVDLKTSSLVELARVLDLELMLIPRKMVTTVQGILNYQASDGDEVPRAYQIRGDNDDDSY